MSTGRWWTPAAAMAALLAAVVLLSEECGARRRQAEALDEGMPCPARSERQEARENRIRAILASTSEGRALFRRLDTPVRLCFGESLDSGIRPDGTVTLDARAGDEESAARLGHLLHHSVEGSPLAGLEDPTLDCDRVVADAVEAEARAHALEMLLRERLGVEDPLLTYPFEEEARRAPESERVAIIRDFFLSEPVGGGAAGLVRAYRRRCDDARRSGR